MISSLLIKPAGPDCNLRCTYCFYRQKAELFEGSRHRMSDEVLETLIKQAMRMGIRTFSWQGGEPTMMGLDFYQKAVDLESKYGWPGDVVANALQTNGTLIDEKWAKFLAKYSFLIGLSIDGPEKLHDHYRKDPSGGGSLKRVMHAAKVMREHGVEYNVLALVNDLTAKEPEKVYDYLVKNDFYFLQFIPCVEPGRDGSGVAPFSVSPEDYGDFLVRIFDCWVKDFPNVSIREFDALLLQTLGRNPGMCTLSQKCADYVVIEHNGDVFACDFFVTPEWKLGNIMETPLSEIVKSEKLEQFARNKSEGITSCRSCPFYERCYGGCPKYRLVDGGSIDEPGYFCQSYMRLFEHASPQLPELAARVAT